MSALPPIATAKADITLAQLSGFLPFPAHGFMQHNTGIIGQFWKPSRVNIEATAWPSLDQRYPAISRKLRPDSLEKNMNIKLASDEGRNMCIAVFGTDVDRVRVGRNLHRRVSKAIVFQVFTRMLCNPNSPIWRRKRLFAKRVLFSCRDASHAMSNKLNSNGD